MDKETKEKIKSTLTCTLAVAIFAGVFLFFMRKEEWSFSGVFGGLITAFMTIMFAYSGLFLLYGAIFTKDGRKTLGVFLGMCAIGVIIALVAGAFRGKEDDSPPRVIIDDEEYHPNVGAIDGIHSAYERQSDTLCSLIEEANTYIDGIEDEAVRDCLRELTDRMENIVIEDKYGVSSYIDELEENY